MEVERLIGKSLTKASATPYSAEDLEGLAELLDLNIRTGHDMPTCFNGNTLSRLIAQAYRTAKLEAERDRACDGLASAVETIRTLGGENERLNAALRYEQHREGRIGTHSPNCHTWGPQHYECAIAKLEVAEADLKEAREALRPFAEAAKSFRPDDADTMRPACVQAIHFRAASRAMGDESSPDHSATKAGDGGWLFVKSLFAPRTVTRLSVPGAGPDGMHRIEVGLSDGSSVMVTGVNHQAAWQSLADAAAALRTMRNEA